MIINTNPCIILMNICMTLTSIGHITLRIYITTQMTGITRGTSSGTTTNSSSTSPLTSKTILITAQMIRITDQGALHTTIPEFEAASLLHSQTQRSLTTPTTTRITAPLVRTTLLEDHHLITKSVIPVYDLLIDLLTLHITHTPEGLLVPHFLDFKALTRGLEANVQV